MFLPMSCTSRLTVAMTILPLLPCAWPEAAICGLDGLERSLRGGGGLQKLRQEYRAFLEAVAHGVQCGDQRDIHYVQRFAHCQRGVRGGAGLGPSGRGAQPQTGRPRPECGGADLGHGGGGLARLRRLAICTSA